MEHTTKLEEEAAMPIYLDYNATTPIAKEVAEEMLPYLTHHFGNPSSSHRYGAVTKQAVQRARKQVAEALECDPDEVIFTSGGTEANNYAIIVQFHSLLSPSLHLSFFSWLLMMSTPPNKQGYALEHRDKGDHIITSAIEHPAVSQVCDHLEREHRFRVTRLPVDRQGLISLQDLQEAISPSTLLITVMHANNETGTVQPIGEISALLRRLKAEGRAPQTLCLHSDCAQSFGKVPLSVREWEGLGMLSICGHKLYAPKGVGALYVRRGVSLKRLMHGAPHEGGRRPGTENVLEVVGLGAASRLAAADLESNARHMKEMRDRLHQRLEEELEKRDVPPAWLVLNGHPELRLPNTLSLAFPRIQANALLSAIEDRVAASAGAACHADKVSISEVLKAMQVPLEHAMGTIRFSTGRLTTRAEVDEAANAIAEAAARMYHSSPQPKGRMET